MKYIFMGVLVLLSRTTQAQGIHVTDTLNYLRYIVSNKQQFIGQSFSVLKDSLKINIKYFCPFGAYHFDQSKETDTEFAFNYSQNLEDFYLTYPSLNIIWQQPLNLPNARQIFRSLVNSNVAWNTKAYQHYANAIIKDITVVE